MSVFISGYHRQMNDEICPVVVDFGSRFIKAGWGGNDAPSTVLPSLVGIGTPSGPFFRSRYVGDTVLSQRSFLKQIVQPIKDGVIQDFVRNLLHAFLLERITLSL